MRLWLTRQTDGKYMATMFLPVIKQEGLSGTYDAYVEPGDPVGTRNLCRAIIERELPRLDLEPLTSIRIKWNIQLDIRK